jgi:hypothetical protein
VIHDEYGEDGIVIDLRHPALSELRPSRLSRVSASHPAGYRP